MALVDHPCIVDVEAESMFDIVGKINQTVIIIRWSKPHVSSLYMQCLTDLHMALVDHPCIVDVEAESKLDIVNKHNKKNNNRHKFIEIR